MRRDFGAGFMIGEVPEAAQAQAGMQAYGGQFGCFLPVIYATRDILSFVDTQDYDTPPLEGLTETAPSREPPITMWRSPKCWCMVFRYKAIPKCSSRRFHRKKLGWAFRLRQHRRGTIQRYQPLRTHCAISSKADPMWAASKLRKAAGYPAFKGAMFWAINEDRRNNYRMSNAIGPFLRSIPAYRHS